MKRLWFFVVFFYIIFIGIHHSFAQSIKREKVNQSIEWFAVNSNIKLHTRFGVAFDGQLRFAKDFQSMQHYVRAGLEVYITPNFSVVPFGYMYLWNFLYGEQPASFIADEQRFWQQVVYKQKFGRFNIQHRARLEQRFIEKTRVPNGNLVNNFYLNRIRYRFFVNYPINKVVIEEGSLFINVWNEVFYGWGNYDTFHEPDQNRLSFGLGYQLNSKTQFLAGVLYQMMIKNNGAKQENNVGILAQFMYNLDLCKKEETH